MPHGLIEQLVRVNSASVDIVADDIPKGILTKILRMISNFK
jgi:hypothetical protein